MNQANLTDDGTLEGGRRLALPWLVTVTTELQSNKNSTVSRESKNSQLRPASQASVPSQESVLRMGETDAPMDLKPSSSEVMLLRTSTISSDTASVRPTTVTTPTQTRISSSQPENASTTATKDEEDVSTSAALTVPAMTTPGTALSNDEEDKHNSTTGTDTGILTTTTPTSTPPSLQVFVVTAPAHAVYRERLLANVRGWQRDFPDLKVFTFDDVPPNISSELPEIHQIKRQALEKNKKQTNLLLAAFGAIHKLNPNADFYLLAEDDTILVKKNIDDVVSSLAIANPKNDVYVGKCVRIYSKKMGKVNFAMGGAGVLVSGDLLRRMAPGIDQCRSQYKEFQHGDARIAACLMSMDLMPTNFCNTPGMGGYHFSSSSAWHEASFEWAAKARVVTIHEKDPVRIRFLNEALADLGASHQNVTWKTMKPYLDHFVAAGAENATAKSIAAFAQKSGNTTSLPLTLSQTEPSISREAVTTLTLESTPIITANVSDQSLKTSHKKSNAIPPSLQVFVVTAPANEVYRERLLANARGWHRQFPDLPMFTFDTVPTNASSYVSRVHQIERYPYEKNKKRSNLLLAAFGAIHKHNPNADFYLLTEDDTILVKKNIDDAVASLAASNPQNDVYVGKCVRVQTKKMGSVDFAMGGAGILMSGDLLRQMAPGIEQCRDLYKDFQHGDVRIAACLKSMNLFPGKICTTPGISGFHFSSSSAWREASLSWTAKAKIVTIHEKDPLLIQVLNEAIADLVQQGRNVTWGALEPYLDKFTATGSIATDTSTTIDRINAANETVPLSVSESAKAPKRRASLALSNVSHSEDSSLALNESSTMLASKEISLTTVSSSLQVFVVTAPAQEVYRERLLANAAGWHRAFPDLQVFTFDEVPTNISALNTMSTIHQIHRHPFEKNKKRTNLLLAAFGAIHKINPNADFYLLTEDDTVVVKKNIDAAVARLSHRKDVFTGKCVRIVTKKMGNVDFAMGGAGILLSGDLLRGMAPRIEECRALYKEFQHGDTRIAACLKLTNLMPEYCCNDTPELGSLHFTSASAWREATTTQWVTSPKVVTMHEKDPERIRVLNDAIADLDELKQDVTWETLKPYLNTFAGNKTMY